MKTIKCYSLCIQNKHATPYDFKESEYLYESAVMKMIEKALIAGDDLLLKIFYMNRDVEIAVEFPNSTLEDYRIAGKITEKVKELVSEHEKDTKFETPKEWNDRMYERYTICSDLSKFLFDLHTPSKCFIKCYICMDYVDLHENAYWESGGWVCRSCYNCYGWYGLSDAERIEDFNNVECVKCTGKNPDMIYRYIKNTDNDNRNDDSFNEEEEWFCSDCWETMEKELPITNDQRKKVIQILNKSIMKYPKGEVDKVLEKIRQKKISRKDASVIIKTLGSMKHD